MKTYRIIILDEESDLEIDHFADIPENAHPGIFQALVSWLRETLQAQEAS